MAIDDVEAAFRAQMRARAHKGGAATKRRYGYDPTYYRDIGRRGGNASVAARKARIAAELEGVRPGDAPMIEPVVAPTEVPPTAARPKLTLREILADANRTGQRETYVSYRRDSVEDRMAEESIARFIAQIQQHSEDDEPWDPWDRRQ